MGTAKATFDKAINRAEYLVKLGEALTNHRQRRARADWSCAFKKIMRWPQSHSIERIDSRDVVLVLRDGAKLSHDDFNTESLDDLFRAALVMAVSAMDAYFHAKILRYVVTHSKTNKPHKRLLNEKILVKDFIDGHKKKQTNSALYNAIKRNLSYQSLQQPDKISDCLNLIGVINFWPRIASELQQDCKSLKKRILTIIKRRNQIAHEGDLSQSTRVRNQSRKISKKSVKDSIELLKQVVHEADTIINNR